MKLENFELLENKVRGLVEQFAALKRERGRIEGVLKKKHQEHRDVKVQLEKLNRERYYIRAKVDALINKIEGMEERG